MGVISRKVLPVCGNLCICCPGLRARSRQPVKRYKTLLADIFPKTQTEPPNERKISKLTEYAYKNPHRIPKIAKMLELRGYKEIRHEHYGSIRTIMRTFCSLFSTCKEQMSLYAVSALNMILVLLEQQNDEMRILGCLTAVEFINHQVDTTYMQNLDAFVPKFCSLAQESGPEQRRDRLRAAGLQALSAMLWFMGEFSHISPNLDEVVTAVLENYEKGFVKEALTRFSESSRLNSFKSLTKEEAEMPKVWAQICVQNLACLGKEATTVRRVLESVFNHFDTRHLWIPHTVMPLAVLRHMMVVMEKTGNEYLVLVALVRHLGHKNIGDDLQLKRSIVSLTATLARLSQPRNAVMEVSVISDLSRELRKCFQSSFELLETDFDNLRPLYDCLQNAIEQCLMELVKRVGEGGPILELMAVILEKLSSTSIVARTTVEVLAVLSHMVVHLTRVDFTQSFPEGLFYQLLRAMIYPDVDTRLGSHHIFSVLVAASPSDGKELPTTTETRIFFRRPSTAADALLARLSRSTRSDSGNEKRMDEPKDTMTSTEGNSVEMTTVRLSGHQVWLLLSNLRAQAVMPDNVPASYEAIFQSFTLALLLSRPRSSTNSTCVRAFQLALSLRTLALDSAAVPSASRRRSLLTLATAMVSIAAVVYEVPDVVQLAKSVLTAETKDPFLEVGEDNRLKLRSDVKMENYANSFDEQSAAEVLSRVSIPDQASNEALVSLITKSAPSHLEMDTDGAREQMLQPFVADDFLSFGPNIQLDAFDPTTSLPLDSLALDEVLPAAEDDNLSQTSGFGLPPLLADAPVPPATSSAMGVNQLLESALEAAGQVASITAPGSPVSYSSLATHCEESVERTRRNMSLVMKLDAKPKEEPGPWTQAVQSNESPAFSPPWVTPSPKDGWPPVKLPPASPYDNFLKAAGC